MSLKTAITNDMSVFFNTDEFAETVTYNSVSVTGIVSYKENLSDQGSSKEQLADLELQKSEVSSWSYRDPVVIGGVTWRVRKEITSDDDSWTLEIGTDKRAKL